MKTYEILRDGQLFGGFQEGQRARVQGEAVDDKFMIQEFNQCVNHWAYENSRRVKKWKWELRIILSDNRND